MNIRILFTVVLLSFISDSSHAAPEAIKQLIIGDRTASATAAKELENHPPESLAVWIRGFNDFPPPDTTGWAIELFHPINDTLTAPAWLYIPTGYDPSKRTPFVISMHGGVSGAKFRDASAKNWLDEPVIQIAEREGWLVLYPLGMTGCAWWDATGMQNILWYVREVKRRFNVDDDRVALCGFSDGGSGSFHFAMLAPTDFAVFFPWSGSPAVGTIVSGIQTYLPNLSNRPLFVSNGGRDQLYPAAGLEKIMALAIDEGARMNVAFYDTAGHNYFYMPAEWQQMPHRLEISGRNPFPANIYFETADLQFASIDWLKITTIDTMRNETIWHSDCNDRIKDERITIGFNPDFEYKGKGVKLGSVADDPQTPASKAGMQAGDILTMIDKVKVTGMADIAKAKEGRKRGDPITLTFKRGSKTIKFDTNYPPAEEFDAFPRKLKSAAIVGKRVGNSFGIQSMRTGSFDILLSPELVRFDQPVKVLVGETAEEYQEAHNAIVPPDAKTLLDSFLADRDRTRLVFARLHVEVPAK